MFNAKYVEIHDYCRKLLSALDNLKITSPEYTEYNFVNDVELAHYWYREFYEDIQ
jgi:hypothetical protein